MNAGKCNAQGGGIADPLVVVLKALDFEECVFDGELNECEKCGKEVDKIYFGNADYWDCREGDFWCGDCVLSLHEANERDYVKAMASTPETPTDSENEQP